MPEDKPELSSAELIRQARETFAVPQPGSEVSAHVDGPTIQELLAAPLSSDSLLPQRAVDPWAESDKPQDAPWEKAEHDVEPPAAPKVMVSKRRYVAAPEGLPPMHYESDD